MSPADWDVIVLGAGPAGALAARQLAAQSLRVLLVEKQAFPRWKVCGSCLNGHALETLESAGLGGLVARLGGVKLERLRLALGGHQALLPLAVGRALSRRRLDQALVDEAVAVGAELLPRTEALVAGALGGVRSVQLKSASDLTMVTARVVLVATGLAERSFLSPSPISSHVNRGSRVGAGCVLESAPPSYGPGTIHMAVGRQGYVGVVRTETGQANLAAAFDRSLLKSCGGPSAAARQVLNEAGFEPLDAGGPWRATAALTRRSTYVAADRLLVLGDAAGYVEPFTGEGIGWALSSALAVVPLVLQGLSDWDPRIERDWAQSHATLIGRRQRLCHGLAFALRRPRISHALMLAASHLPILVTPALNHLNGSFQRQAIR
ncbi:NAD(P)/FAD-dependent oxidoreductase [Cyanobium sp. Morenito 9A2]|uniref:NAD(P)/FAD-dependent oxidoreductase n=1 Tax=Cyanobium sp. Morenito 9A2 TaxID=2823718 RepID=UPI0020CD63F1|nr:FAD-dependent monooxygenase [Cyanobium sp. Morenito 9A2]MCP9850534.1 FAD-dependent monooxygenase [Cyanobium sp. Morenito 9A2]